MSLKIGIMRAKGGLGVRQVPEKKESEKGRAVAGATPSTTAFGGGPPSPFADANGDGKVAAGMTPSVTPDGVPPVSPAGSVGASALRAEVSTGDPHPASGDGKAVASRPLPPADAGTLPASGDGKAVAASPHKKRSEQQLETEYVHGTISMRALAEKYGVPLSRISYAAKRHKWSEKRRQFRNKVRTKADKKAVARKSDALLRIGEASELLIDRIYKAAGDVGQLNQHAVLEKDGRAEAVDLQIIDAKTVRNLVGAVKELTDVIRDVYNIPREQEQTQEIKLVLPEALEGFDV